MLCIISDSTDPYYNLATEEYLLRNSDEDIFMLYVNEPSIIVGKHQNAISEINLDYTQSNNLKVARRLSGGGTVFHDMGNLNFCFICTTKGNNKVNFKKYTQPIIEVLNDLNINASSGGRNDIVAEGFKISGNAEHVFKDRVLHHGTLLFESDLNALSSALKVNLSKFEDRSVQSVRSNVINIKDILDESIEFLDFKDRIFKKVLARQNAVRYFMSEDDKKKINELYLNKFSTWDWNYGYSPKYSYSNSKDLHNGNLRVSLIVEKGRITMAEIFYNDISFSDEAMNRLIALRHFPADLKWLNEVSLSLSGETIPGEEIYSLLF